MRLTKKIMTLAVMLFCMAMQCAMAETGKTIIVQSTTSTKNSGLYDHILPMFHADTGITAHIVAVGTGAAIKNAMHCDGDVLLVHSRDREEQFIRDGFADTRYDLMVNDFVIIGPDDDPAGIRKSASAADAFTKIAKSNSDVVFTSRGDDSGTHAKEMAIWEAAGIDPRPHSGGWYRELGAGMGTTINAAVGMRGYALADRASWIQFRNKSDLAILFEGDARLENPYGVLAVSPRHCPQVNHIAAKIFIDWLISPIGQNAIASHRVDGVQLFHPAAR